MLLLELLWSFVKIGITSFGGLSMIPLVSSEMVGHGWMTAAEVGDIVAIAEMTPGPLGLNCATFAGMRTAGILGALMANLGVLSPTFTIGLLAAGAFERFKKSTLIRRILLGVRPGCVGLIAGVVFNLSQSNYLVDGSYSPAAIVIGVLDLILLRKFKLSIPVVIIISAALGLLCFGFWPMMHGAL